MRHHGNHRFATRVGLTLAIAATAAPGAAVAASPDVDDYNQAAQQAHDRATQSPDARTLNLDAKEQALQTPDKVTPDARDAGDGRKIVVPPRPTIVVQRVSPADGGIEWGDVGLGAAGTLGLVLVASGGVLTVTRRRGTHVRQA
jgi:hypothetical protein